MIYKYLYSIFAILIFTILMYEGIKLIFFQNIYVKSGRFLIAKINLGLQKKLYDKDINHELHDAGLKMSFNKWYKSYQKSRYLIFFIFFIYLIIKLILNKTNFNLLIIGILLYVLSTPRLKIGKHWTPFGHILKQIDLEVKNKQDTELASIIIQIQNIAISQKDEPTTLSYILTRIIRFSKYTKNGFIKMVSYIDQNNVNEAKLVFIEEIDTTLGRDLAYVLIELDNISPSEVVKQLKVLEERVRSETLTNKNKKEEFYSNILYIIPTALCFLILMNFLKIILTLVMNLVPLQ
ncbi:hypothetical protein JYG23_09455 [Sedimentibacter sp. zth1]|uniref:hypothetical protein n=1 Tax=Sedimentibacter sp. zth1 TaxID=2816908 RepID=UPI001A915D90|nr:hypothetical protein [Sedimentibacter sp. zth1]QSX04917.1 hypothetical protein JYG23_09455 [Sedimentibacter sp. zth1]